MKGLIKKDYLLEKIDLLIQKAEIEKMDSMTCWDNAKYYNREGQVAAYQFLRLFIKCLGDD